MPKSFVSLMVALVALALVLCGQKSAQGPAREFTNSVGMKFVRIDPGSFKMGSDKHGPVHDVTLSKGYYLQTTEVTQAQWQAVMGANPSTFAGPDRPVENVSWDDTQEFLRRLNAKEKDTRYRLPTEAEWECGCRAGSQEPDEAPNLDEVAWSAANSGGETHPAGQKKPNAWGLYDMRGNVGELVQDWYGQYPAGRQVDPQGPPSGDYRVVRGGSWAFGPPNYFRCADRFNLKPGYRHNIIGFRCARTF
ncbi:MAG: formylglycine-generating enzyme family protein [Bryobacteraceae bacterium]